MLRAEYTFYKLNISGMVDTAAVHRLADDFSALDHARAMNASQPVEIWRGRCKIGLVVAKVDRRVAMRGSA